MIFKRVPTILTAKELIDKAFGQAAKINPPVHKYRRLESVKEKEIAKIDAVGQIVTDQLQEILDKVPDIDSLPAIYRELLKTFVDYRDLKQSLGAVKWAKDGIQALTRTYRKRFSGIHFKQYASERKAYYGRVSSLLKQIDSNLIFLERARGVTRKLPNFKDLPTVILAGYPNVGKSSLMKALTGAKPDIQPFPFTTKGVLTGILNEQIQIVDTPGLLERPLEKRNDIEMTAIVALQHIAGKIVFVIDPTDAAGYALKDQLALLKSVERQFNQKPVIILNKIDLMVEDQILEVQRKIDYRTFAISAEKGRGVREFELYLLKNVDWKTGRFKE